MNCCTLACLELRMKYFEINWNIVNPEQFEYCCALSPPVGSRVSTASCFYRLSLSQRTEAQSHEGARREVSAAGVRRQRNEDCRLLPLVDHILCVCMCAYVWAKEREREQVNSSRVVIYMGMIMKFSVFVTFLSVVIWPTCSLSQPTYPLQLWM